MALAFKVLTSEEVAALNTRKPNMEAIKPLIEVLAKMKAGDGLNVTNDGTRTVAALKRQFGQAAKELKMKLKYANVTEQGFDFLVVSIDKATGE